MRAHNPATITKAHEDEFTASAKKINAAHSAGERDAKRALRHYRDAGRELVRVKNRCKRKGVKFGAWLEKNVKFSTTRPRSTCC